MTPIRGAASQNGNLPDGYYAGFVIHIIITAPAIPLMVEKQYIIATLGEGVLLLPSPVNAALAASDRSKLYPLSARAAA